MINGIVRFSLNNRLLVILLFLVAVGTGVVSLLNISIDAFPDTTPVQVQINTTAPALNSEEIEQQITLPVELSIGGLPGLVDVRSVSKFGLSQVVATFDDSISVVDARQYISERLRTVELPQGIKSPELGPISTGLGEVFHYTVSSENPERTLEQLRTLHDWIIKPELRKVPGVAEVNSWGGYERQYHVIVSPTALVKYHLTLDDLFTALRKNNQNVGGGVVTEAGQSKLVRGVGRATTVEEIEGIILASFDGTPVRVRDIAKEVKIGHEIRRGAVTAQGQGEVVLGLAFMLMGENGQEVTERLKTQLANVKKSIPDDVNVDIVYDRTEMTKEVVKTARHNLFAGAVLVILVLFILLGNLRAGLLVALVIPTATLFAIMGMYEFAISASLLSLGAIDFGILVDGSVVITEANMRTLNERALKLGRPLTSEERKEAIIQSGTRVTRPIVFGVGIILVVFIPVLTLEGTEGKLFGPMAWTFIFALAGALITALMLSPVLNYYFLPRQRPKREGRFISALVRVYVSSLQRAFKYRRTVFAAVLVLLVSAGWMATRLGGEFIPRLNEGAIVINTIRLAGVSIEESTAYNTRIESLLLAEFPDEIRSIWSRIGTAEVATDPMGIELTDTFISLKPRDEWTNASSQTELVAAMQTFVGDLPGANFVFTQPIEMRLNEMESGIRSDLGIKIYGDDFDELIRISDQVQRILIQIEGQSDVSVDQITGQPTLQVVIDQNAVARYGVPAEHVLEMVELLGGKQVGEIYEGQRTFPLVVRLAENHRVDSDSLKRLTVPTEEGYQLPLHVLADITETDEAATINREWGRRLIRVQCNVVDRDVASFVEEAQRRIGQEIDLPDGYVIDWGGQFENLQRAELRLSIIVPVTLLLVFFLLYFSLKNMRDVLLIYTGIPLALIGGVFALWIRGMPFSVSAAVGFIALCGIAVLNGQILVSAIREFRSAGESLRDSVTRAASQRLSPVLATAITDAAGFLPMVMSTALGAEVQRPLATVVVGGVLTSTLLTLFVLPLLYTRFGKGEQPEAVRPGGGNAMMLTGSTS
ncbi:CusA/CzcA family heavy metal efflux RND transporter [Porticoccaceae bacterium LTM1]|nr:CusA/CzcA family heavy metal efflux RND transporter [Porticoccaceae bacterium LTM1]